MILLAFHFVFFPTFHYQIIFFKKHLKINQILYRHQNKIKYRRREKYHLRNDHQFASHRIHDHECVSHDLAISNSIL